MKMQYQTVHQNITWEHQAASFAELDRKVNELLEQGWEPLGGIAIHSFWNGQAHLAQAMIRRTQEK